MGATAQGSKRCWTSNVIAELLQQHCSIAAALEAVGLLVLPDPARRLQRLHHFEEFQTTLGIARNILSNRLGRLVENGILERVPDASDRRKVSYRLTEKGRDLLPVLLSLRQWGERWVSGQPSNPVLVDRYSRQPIAPMAVQSCDGRALSLNELEWLDRSELGAKFA